MPEVTEETRHLTASAVVLDLDAGKVLLVMHKLTGKLMFPGGHVDDNEAPHEAALREVLEETGVHAELTCQLPLILPNMTWLPRPWVVAEIPAPADPGDDEWPPEPAHSHIDMLYIALADSNDPLTTQPDEVDSAGWYRITGLREENVRAEVPQRAWDAERMALTHRDRIG